MLATFSATRNSAATIAISDTMISNSFIGVISPYATVVNVANAQYVDSTYLLVQS